MNKTEFIQYLKDAERVKFKELFHLWSISDFDGPFALLIVFKYTRYACSFKKTLTITSYDCDEMENMVKRHIGLDISCDAMYQCEVKTYGNTNSGIVMYELINNIDYPYKVVGIDEYNCNSLVVITLE